MSKDVEVTVLMPVENFVVYKNKIRKEMAETPAEDLEAYKKFEWERAYETWGPSWNNIKNDKVRKDLLAQVRDVLGYSVEDYPVTDEEVKAENLKYKQKMQEMKRIRLQEKLYMQELALKEAQEAWDKLTPEEQEAKLKEHKKDATIKFLWISFSSLIAISGIVFALIS
jgi:hypothetical protein